MVTAKQLYFQDLILALSWEGKKPIPFRFEEPLRIAVEKAVLELYAEEHPDKNNRDKRRPHERDIGCYVAVSMFQPRELGCLLEDLFYYRRERINPWDYFETARGSWWQGLPLKPQSELYFQQLKDDMRRRFGKSYELLVEHFLPHFQELAKDYR